MIIAIEVNRGLVRTTAQWGRFPDCENSIIARKESDANDCIILATNKYEYDAEYHKHTLKEIQPLIPLIIALFNRFEELHNREGYMYEKEN